MTNELPDPSVALKNKTHERFCQNRANGNSGGRSWALASRPDDPDSLDKDGANSSALRAGKRPEVRARLDYLMRQRTAQIDPAAGPLSRNDLERLLNTITTKLTDLYQKAISSGASHSDRTRLKRLITTHSGRVASLNQDRPEPKKALGEFDYGVLDRVYVCRCDRD